MRIAENDRGSHRHELVNEEEPALEHLLEEQRGAARLRRHAAEDERLRREQERDLAVRPEMPASPVRRRPGGMVVLELDDEDPSFDHLPTYDFAMFAQGADSIQFEKTTQMRLPKPGDDDLPPADSMVF